MKNKRRDFLLTTAAYAVGSTLLGACSKKSSMSSMASSSTGDLDKFGIQLYTLRDVIMDDPFGTIESLSTYGFRQIEGFEGEKGIFWGKTPKEFKSYINDLGIAMTSSHCNIHENFEQKAADAAEAGLSYLICPWIGPQKSVADWKAVTEKFNACGETCRKNGIRFAYHNHAYSFVPFSGMIPQDYMMENTDPAIVDHQMDIYWVVTGGADPVEYFKKYPGRFKLCHVKDRMADTDERMASCTLGTGIIDYPRILKQAKDHGMEFFIMEQERYDGTTPMAAAKDGAAYLSKLKFA